MRARSVSLRGLRPLPLGPVLPERAARRPGHAAAQPRTGLRSGRAGGVGPRRGDALRPGDRPGAGADSPGRARAGAAQRGGARPDRRGLPRQPPRSAAAATEALATARRQTPSAAASRSTGSVSPSPLTATRSTPPPAEELPGRPRADSRRPTLQLPLHGLRAGQHVATVTYRPTTTRRGCATPSRSVCAARPATSHWSPPWPLFFWARPRQPLCSPGRAADPGQPRNQHAFSRPSALSQRSALGPDPGGLALRPRSWTHQVWPQRRCQGQPRSTAGSGARIPGPR